MAYLAFVRYTCHVVSLSLLPWIGHCNDRIDPNACCDSFRAVSFCSIIVSFFEIFAFVLSLRPHNIITNVYIITDRGTIKF